MNKIKPFLKWAGNKFQCIEHVKNALSPANRLIEPFAGSGAVFVNTDYSNYLLAESNKDLVDLYNYLKNEGENFIDFCASYFTPDNNTEACYYTIREKFNRTLDTRQRSAFFLYLNRHGYNGLCRYNQGGGYNVPFGRYIKPYFPRKEMLHFYHKAQQAEFINKDFRETFKQARSGDLIYCDPPYVPLSKSANFTSYSIGKFMEKEQLDLVKLAIEASNKGITTVLSNHDTEFTRHHYQQGEIISFPVKRIISCHSETRKPVRELIAIFRGV